MAWRFCGALFLGVCLGAGLAQAASDKPKPSASPTGEVKPEVKPEPRKDDPGANDPQLTTATYGDWTERCQRVTLPEGVRRVCEVSLAVIPSGQTQPIAEVAIGHPKKAAPLRLTVVLPVNVSFPSAPKVVVAGGDPVELSWKQCVPAGCFADAAFEGDMADAWRTAKSAKIESKAANGAAFGFDISLRGLAPALDALGREP